MKDITQLIREIARPVGTHRESTLTGLAESSAGREGSSLGVGRLSSKGGSLGDFTEANISLRTYYDPVSLFAPDGSSALIAHPLKSITLTLPDGSSVTFRLKNPYA